MTVEDALEKCCDWIVHGPSHQADVLRSLLNSIATGSHFRFADLQLLDAERFSWASIILTEVNRLEPETVQRAMVVARLKQSC